MERRIFIYTDPHSPTLIRRIMDHASVADFVIGLGDYTHKDRSFVPRIVFEFTDIPLMGNHDTGAVRCGRITLYGYRFGLLGGVYSIRRDRTPRDALGHDDWILNREIPIERGRLLTERYLVSYNEGKRVIKKVGPVGYEGYYTTAELENVISNPIDIFLSHDGPRIGNLGDVRIKRIVQSKKPKLLVHGHHHILNRYKLDSTEVVSLDRAHGLIIKTGDDLGRFLIRLR